MVPVFISLLPVRRLKIINGVSIPQEDNRGRAFPYKDTGPHYMGPAIVNGKLMTIKVWENVAENGRKYLRFIFDESHLKQD